MFKNKHLPKVELKTFTKESLTTAFPVAVNITDAQLQKINTIAKDNVVADAFRENLIGFAAVLTKQNISFSNYINAVKFTSLVIMDYTYRQAWELTFPDKYKKMVEANYSNKQIHSNVASYRRSKIVTLVSEQALVPSYIYNATHFQEAINTQVSIMRDETVLPKDRIAAADSVLKYTAVPETLIGNKDDIAEQGISVVAKLADTLNTLAQSHHGLIEQGKLSAKTVAESKIFEGEIINES